MLSQFGDEAGHPGLGRLLPELMGRPFRPAGRLDRDSEGLLVITDSGRLQARITEPGRKLPKTYWVQVEGDPEPAQLAALAGGVLLNDGLTLPAQVRAIPTPELWPRTPPVRYRAAIPTHWLEIQLTEGRNRQVRRMTAAVGLPTLRLVRVAVGPWHLDALRPGEWCWNPIPSNLLAT